MLSWLWWTGLGWPSLWLTYFVKGPEPSLYAFSWVPNKPFSRIPPKKYIANFKIFGAPFGQFHNLGLGPIGFFSVQIPSSVPPVEPWWILLLRIHLLSNLLYKWHQIPKLKCFSSRLAVVFAQSLEVSREWRCSWSSADRRCPNYIWVFNNFIAS